MERSGRKKKVEAVYRKTNLNLDSDLAMLKKTARIATDPAALARAEPWMSDTGKIAEPIIVVDNDDPVDA